MMQAFASHFRFAPEASPGTHDHHEWFEGNQHIAAEFDAAGAPAA